MKLTLHGDVPHEVHFDLPSFIDNVSSTSNGHVDEATGTVTMAQGASSVTVQLRHSP